MLKLSPRMRKKTSLLDPVARPSVSVSASKSKSLRSTMVSLSPLSVVVHVADSVAAVREDVDVVAVVNSEATVATDVDVVMDLSHQEVKAVALLEALHVVVLLPSTLRTRVLSQAWGHRLFSQKSPIDLHSGVNSLR